MKKKFGTLCLTALILALMLSGCGQSEAAKAVDDQIAAIGEVTLDSEAAITAAEQAVEGLEEADRESLKNMQMLSDARATYETLVVEEQASQVEEAISAIGEATLDSAGMIADARSMYDGSTAEVQAAVSNLDALTTAESQLAELQAAQVVELIDAIGDVTLEKAGSIHAAEEALEALPEEAAALVTNTDVLTSAAAQLETLSREQGEALLQSMRMEGDEVRGMYFYYPSQYPNYIDTRCYMLPYIGRDSDRVWLRLMFDYTGDDWIFFDNLTIAVDDERYYKSFNYFDVTRDNDYGVVWEYADCPVSESDIDLLWAVANSSQTIVRFEGDDYRYDHTVSESDKQAIRDVLTAFEALSYTYEPQYNY